MINATQIYNAGTAAQWRRIVFGDSDETITIPSTVNFTGSVSLAATVASVTFTTSLTTAAGKIGMGTTPGSAGAINVDHAAYTGPTVIAIGAITTPSAYAVTTSALFPSTVSGATLMGFGTTGDVTLKNRAGTSVAYVMPNTNQFQVANQFTVGTPNSSAMVSFANGMTAVSTSARAVYIFSTLIAAANSDTLQSLKILPVHTPGAFTGLVATGLTVDAFSVAGFTTPGSPVGINVGVITGTGASVATALQLAPPTGATTNAIIAHTTFATFNVLATGQLTTASHIFLGSASTFQFSGRANLTSGGDGILSMRNNAQDGFTSLFRGTSGGATSVCDIQKAVTAIADNVATAVLTVTVPNSAQTATVRVRLKGALGAGGAIGADEASGSVSYDITVARTTGVNAVAIASSAYGSAMANVAGAATITVVAAVSAIAGAVGDPNTFTVNVTIARGSGSATNHTCMVFADVLNGRATGVTIA